MVDDYLKDCNSIYQMNIAIWQKTLGLFANSFSSNSSFILNDLKAIKDFLYNNSSKLQQDLFEGQIKLSEYYRLKFLNQNPNEVYSCKPKDNRFKDAAWQDNLFFNYIKQSYFLLHEVILANIKESNLPASNKKRLIFSINFLFNALAPSNFFVTNPEIIYKTIETRGANLVQGYNNFIRDVNASNKYLNIQSIDPLSFIVGKDIAKTQGKVIFKNDLFELIEYYPTNAKEYEIPLLIVPPCINKYYILDLQEKNSFVFWLLNQGYKVYLISWNNPESESILSFDSYVLSGIIAALNITKEASAIKKVNLIGYCIGGTMSLCAAAYLRKKGETCLNSITLLTALADFSEAGDISYFINDQTIETICNYTKLNGGFSGEDMTAIFNSLKPSETIWNNYINNYFLGKKLGNFDILFWNADSTRLSTNMHEKYLKEFYIHNKFVREGVVIGDALTHISNLKEDFYIVATIEDHIVPWKSVYSSLQSLINNNIEFTLVDSGHVAGIINSPSANKYCYWKNSNILLDSSKWLDEALKTSGSWWIDLNNWLQVRSGKKVNATISKFKELESAPGSYVLKK